MHVFADPKNMDTVYVLNVSMYRSTDGGKTFNTIRQPHGDNHGLWIDPDNPQRIINGSDGGAAISVDGAKSWSTLYNQPTGQFYHVIATIAFLITSTERSRTIRPLPSPPAAMKA
jgi:hypothetical protein